MLVSPKDPDKPKNLSFLMGGENSFTRNLLENPPSEVEYIFFEDALKSGQIEYLKWHKILNLLVKFRILPLDGGFQAFWVKSKFDLIHCHGYCLMARNYNGRVVLSDSSSNYLFLKKYLNWSDFRIKTGYFLRKIIVKNLNIYDPNLNLQDSPLVVWSEFAKKIHISLGQNPQKITVIPPGIGSASFRKIKQRKFNILFIGIWFERKGGFLLLEVYKSLQKKYPQISLTVIGQIPKKIKLGKNTIHFDYLPKNKIYKKIYPKADVLVLVPEFVEGYGLVVEEAAGYSIPSVVSSVCALPELVDDKKTGFIISPGDFDGLFEALEKLILNPKLKYKLGKQAYLKFKQKYFYKKTNLKLQKIYQNLP